MLSCFLLCILLLRAASSLSAGWPSIRDEALSRRSYAVRCESTAFYVRVSLRAKALDGKQVAADALSGAAAAGGAAKQKRIDELGGTATTPGSQTSNKRNPISPECQKELEPKK
jgi:hypothetical protein